MAFSQHDMLFIFLSISRLNARVFTPGGCCILETAKAHHFNGGKVLIKSWQVLLPIMNQGAYGLHQVGLLMLSQ